MTLREEVTRKAQRSYAMRATEVIAAAPPEIRDEVTDVLGDASLPVRTTCRVLRAHGLDISEEGVRTYRRRVAS